MVAVVSDGDSIIARYADEVLVAAGSEKVKSSGCPCFLLRVNTCWIFCMGWNLARKYQDNLVLNQKYEKAGEKSLWGLNEES